MDAEQWTVRLRTAADRLPTGEPIFQTARAQVLQAANVVAGGLQVDPTLVDDDRAGRDLDVLAELLRQLKPLARQAKLTIEHERLVEDSAPHDIAWPRRLSKQAPEEFAALAAHLIVVAQRIADAAQPDWNTVTRIRERSERRLPSPETITELADRVRAAVQPALDLAYPAPAAVRIADLAEQLRAEAGERPHRCAAPGCEHLLRLAATGRPRVYCGPTCRQRARRTGRTLQQLR